MNTFYLYKTSHQGSFARSLKVLKGEVFVGCVFFLHSFASLLYEKNDHHQMQAAIWCCLLDRRPAFYFQFGQFAKNWLKYIDVLPKAAFGMWRPPYKRSKISEICFLIGFFPQIFPISTNKNPCIAQSHNFNNVGKDSMLAARGLKKYE